MRRWLLVPLALGLAALAGCGAGHDSATATAALTPHGLTPGQLSFLKFTQVAEVEASSVANLSGAIDFDEQHTARLNAAVPGRVVELLVQAGDHVDADQPLVALESPEVRTAQELVHGFFRLVRKREQDGLEDWMVRVTASGIGELAQFCAGLRRDWDAVVAALTLPWSNGPVEGQINRLKLIKRQMYGRAGFALLRARVLSPA